MRMKDYFFRDTEGEHDKLDARNYKTRARAAMTRRSLIKTSGFSATFKRWRANKEKLDGLRNGDRTEQNTFAPDWGKVCYTTVLQIANALLAIVCISGGGWPILLLSIPGLIALNIFLLIKDREGNE